MHRHAVKLDVKAYLLCPWFDELVRLPGILDVIEDLIGPDILCLSSNFRAKKPDRRSHAGWHQGGKYIRLEPDLTLIFVALTEHTVDNGRLRFLPGSQWRRRTAPSRSRPTYSPCGPLGRPLGRPLAAMRRVPPGTADRGLIPPLASSRSLDESGRRGQRGANSLV